MTHPEHKLETGLEVKNLSIAYRTDSSSQTVVRDVSFSVAPGETLAIVGESGCGKSTTALSLLELLPPNASVEGGSIEFNGTALAGRSARNLRQLRGGDMAMVFQDPMSSLNPLKRVGRQIAESLRIHQPMLRGSERADRVVELLRSVGISDPERRVSQYPHEYSGGMRQRAMLAIAIANRPRLLIADEPTTALDVTVQAQIVDLLRIAREETSAGLLLITHDLGLVVELADRVAVMYSGRLVEVGDVAEIFSAPQHPYTTALLRTMPDLAGSMEDLVAIPGTAPQPSALPTGCAFHPRCPVGHDREVCQTTEPPLDGRHGHAAACHFAGEPVPLGAPVVVHSPPDIDPHATVLSVAGLSVEYPLRSGVVRRVTGTVRAVDNVDLTVNSGETVAVVGESGSGKTTLARAVVGLEAPTAGTMTFGADTADTRERLAVHRYVQLVFQDPLSSLNPRMSIGGAIGEPVRAHHIVSNSQVQARVDELLEMVGLGASMRGRYPHQLSGGQRQRVGLARALAMEPRLIVLDEPVSALDVSVQAQILQLLAGLQESLGVAYLFIAHDLAVVGQIADRVLVMYHGRIVEAGTAAQVLGDPQHPYTKALVASIPARHPDDRSSTGHGVRGEPPSPHDEIVGCAFEARCPVSIAECSTRDPLLRPSPAGSVAACHLVKEPQ